MISGNDDAALAEGLNELVDDDYSRKLSANVYQATRTKWISVGVNGKPPLGYRRFHGDPGHERNGSLAVNPQAAATVRRIFELYLQPAGSYASVAVQLNRQGRTTRLGVPFTQGAVAEILQNRTYQGDAVWAPGTPDEKVRPGIHEALIAAEVFAAVATKRARRTVRRGPHPGNHVYPLSGPARCGDCGAPWFGAVGGRLRHAPGYDCPQARSFKAADLEDQLRGLICGRFRLPDNWIEHYRRLLKAPAEPTPVPDGETERLRRAGSRLKQLYTWGDLSAEEYRHQHSAIQRQLDAVTPRTPVEFVNLNRAVELLRDVEAMWGHPATTLAHKRDFVAEVVEEILIDEHGIKSVRPKEEYAPLVAIAGWAWSGWADSNRRPRGPKPRALPD